ncbi:hypothetical protein ACFFWC_26035 [Plantactinospora siamensis]|uniref:Uncharacterized protein n=1 Tax=Plantactinospora siamensis TaxID=555372 RepID=A0ABV6P845_9ACTN
MSTDAPPAEQPGPQVGPPPGRPRRRILPYVVAAWAMLLLGLTYLSVRHDPPTVREQRSLAEAAPVVDRAIGALAAAAGPDALLELGEPRLDRGCRLSVARDGASLSRAVTFRTAPGDAGGLLDRISTGLPAAYRSDTRAVPDGPGPRLRADAGGFVGINGGVTAPGVIELTAATGCRPDSPHPAISGPAVSGPAVSGPAVSGPAGPGPVAPGPAGSPGSGAPGSGAPVRGELSRVFAALALPGSDPAAVTAAVTTVRAGCPDGGVAETDRATAAGTPPGGPAVRLRSLTGAGPAVVDTPELYGFRDGQLGVLVRIVDGETRVSATRGC